MGTRVALVIACAGCLAGCAQDDGVLITIHPANPQVAERVVALELFLAGEPRPEAQGRRYRSAVSGTGDDELITLKEDDELEGFTIFIPRPWGTDVTMAAIVGYDEPPDDDEEYPTAIAFLHPLAAPEGQVTAIDVTLMGLPANGAVDPEVVRRRGPPLETTGSTLSHSCLGWRVMDGGFAVEEIVRVEDFDCDGTLPTGCSDEEQRLFHIPDDLQREDADGDTYFTCETCPRLGRDLPCDCAPYDMDIHVDAEEVCNGENDDCDDRTFYTTPPDEAYPCVDTDPLSGDCDVHLLMCDERRGDASVECRHPTETTVMNPCQIQIPQCDAPGDCPVFGNGVDQVFACTFGIDGNPCLGYRELAGLIDGLDPTPGVPSVPARCHAVLWQAPPAGVWSVELFDLDNPTVGGLLLLDHQCDKVGVRVVAAASGESYRVVVTAFDTVTGDSFSLPIAFTPMAGTPCSIPPLVCLPPN